MESLRRVLACRTREASPQPSAAGWPTREVLGKVACRGRAGWSRRRGQGRRGFDAGASGIGAVAGSGGQTAGAGDSGTVCPLPSMFKWTSGAALAQPQNGWVALKDFTHVVYNSRHVVYMTTHDRSNWGAAVHVRRLAQCRHRAADQVGIRHRADAFLLHAQEDLGARLSMGCGPCTRRESQP